VVVVDLDRAEHTQHVANCSVPPELLQPETSDRLLSASHELGVRQQHVAWPEKSGWVLKRGHWLPAWRQRWVILHHGSIRYWSELPPFHPQEWSEDEINHHTSNDVIQLAGASMTLSPNESEHAEMELITPCSRYPRYMFRFADHTELNEWADAIKKHLWRGPES